MCLRGPAPTASVKKQTPMPISSPRGPLLRLLAAQLVVAGHVQRQPHRRLVVARSRTPSRSWSYGNCSGRRRFFIRSSAGSMSSSSARHVDHPLDQVHRLGDAERAGVGHAAGRLVRVDAGDLAVRGLEVVAAGEDVEEPGRVLGRLGGGVERPVVGDDVDPQAQDLAVAGGRDLAVHEVVAGEPGRHQVLGAVLHPLHRLAGDDRADHRADVARVDRHLVAEAAADVGRDHLDLVLGQAGHQRVHRAVGVRRLGGDPGGELAGHLVHVGDRAAGLHRRRVRARVEHVLGHHDVGAREHLVAVGALSPDSQSKMWLSVLPSLSSRMTGASASSAAGVDHRGQRLVLDVDQLEGVAGGVAVLGDDERDLLALEAHLVGGQHGLDVGRQRRHPRQAQRLEHLAGDDGLDLRVRLGAEVSIETMRACASGLRRMAPCSMPGSWMSSR